MSTRSIQLTEAELALVREVLQRYVPQLEVWVYGSRATGRAVKYSDVDLALITEEPLDIGFVGQIRSAFESSMLPYLVDLTDWARTSPEFRKIIERDHIVIQTPS